MVLLGMESSCDENRASENEVHFRRQVSLRETYCVGFVQQRLNSVLNCGGNHYVTARN